MPAYFCTETNVRITHPGKSKSVDPANGYDECIETEDGRTILVADLLAAQALAASPAPSPSATSADAAPADAAPKSKTTK